MFWLVIKVEVAVVGEREKTTDDIYPKLQRPRISETSETQHAVPREH